MVPTRLLAAVCLLLFLLPLVPTASAATACVGKDCPDGYAVVVDAAGQHVDACVVAVQGSCQPYHGDLVRVHVNSKEFRVPDPCYTTACW